VSPTGYTAVSDKPNKKIPRRVNQNTPQNQAKTIKAATSPSTTKRKVNEPNARDGSKVKSTTRRRCNNGIQRLGIGESRSVSKASDASSNTTGFAPQGNDRKETSKTTVTNDNAQRKFYQHHEESLSGSSLVPWVASIIVGGKWTLTAWSGSSAREPTVAADDVLGVGNGDTGGLSNISALEKTIWLVVL
jgi:hypothetical protein